MYNNSRNGTQDIFLWWYIRVIRFLAWLTWVSFLYRFYRGTRWRLVKAITLMYRWISRQQLMIFTLITWPRFWMVLLQNNLLLILLYALGARYLAWRSRCRYERIKRCRNILQGGTTIEDIHEYSWPSCIVYSRRRIHYWKTWFVGRSHSVVIFSLKN